MWMLGILKLVAFIFKNAVETVIDKKKKTKQKKNKNNNLCQRGTY